MQFISLLTTAALILGSGAAAFAQDTGVQVGPKVGMNVSVLDSQINSETQFKPGLLLGGFVRWRISERIALQPELVYSQQGATNKLNFGGQPAENKINLNYLNIPLLLKIYAGRVVNFQVGPQLGLLLSGRRVGQSSYFSGSNGSGYSTEDTDVTESYKGDFALCGGLGVDLPNGLLGSVRVNYGFTDIDNDSQSIATRQFLNIGGLHNRTIEFSVGYAFGGRK